MIAALLDEDTGETVALRGLVSHRRLHDGQESRYTGSDRLPRTSGRVVRSGVVTLSGVLPGVEGVETEEAVVAMRDRGAVVTIQIPGLPEISGYRIERLDIAGGPTDGRDFTIDLVERRVARARRVGVTAGPSGAPRADVADGLAEDRPQGDRPTSLLSAGLGQITSLLGLGG